jgi:nickel-dependent lactate racemase
MVVGNGFADRYLTNDETRQVVSNGISSLAVDGKRVLVIIPDGTRTMPMPLMYGLLEAHLAPRVVALDYLVALGTHPIIDDERLSKLVGRPVRDGLCGKSRIFNLHWEDSQIFVSQIFVTLGVIPAAEIGELTGGLLLQKVPVRLNKLILDYDQLLICGPVFPHEVAGFSGGTKYLFPGIAGPEEEKTCERGRKGRAFPQTSGAKPRQMPRAPANLDSSEMTAPAPRAFGHRCPLI